MKRRGFLAALVGAVAAPFIRKPALTNKADIWQFKPKCECIPLDDWFYEVRGSPVDGPFYAHVQRQPLNLIELYYDKRKGE